MNITDYFIKLQKLTVQNLEILQALNDSFFSKQTHLTVKIGDNNYAMPSFLALENKVNNLQANFENLVNAPQTGEAYFNFDGNSRVIELRGFTHTPNSLKLSPITKFSVNQNDIFKDFLTPVPHFRVDLKSLPNDITTVNVKKIIPKNKDLVERFQTLLDGAPSVEYNFSELYKIISLYKEDIDYIDYESVKTLPIRKNIGAGTYVIESILSDEIDENLDEYITIKLRSDIKDIRVTNDLSYKLFDETISKQFVVGDVLITYDDSSKLQIVEVLKNTNTIKVKVLYGEYLNLVEDKTEVDNLDNISDMAKLKFFADVNCDEYKYIDIPLEEDQLVFVAVAPLNSRMNIQSSWGTGLILDTDLLTYDQDESIGFKQYYDENVKNIGDLLFEITSTFTSPITALSEDEFNTILTAPVINVDNLQVVQINSHLNNSDTVESIRKLYSQKKRYKTELNEVQTSIDNINTKLASISFDDTTGVRSLYTAQLSEYNTKKNELVASIDKITNEIAISANDSEIPIENAKYHIRGFFDYLDYEKQLNIDSHVIGIEVQYRYKNQNTPTGRAQTISDKFLFSDWNIMESFISKKYPEYDSKFIYVTPPNNDKMNEPSFNQIDIPITQGETVDIKLRVIYDYGYPFIKTTSNWSEIVNIAFPSEFLKDVQILDIISENNDDVETNRFTNIINELGVPNHINDKIIDQDITYFHRPESIASGFYTDERRIIPLKDKLSEMDSKITSISDEILGSSAETLSVSINNGDASNSLYPYQVNNILVEAYSSFTKQTEEGEVADGNYILDKTGLLTTVLNLTITNTSSHTVKLFSLFPGGRDNNIFDLKFVKFNKEDYVKSKTEGVWLNLNDEWKPQTANQYITFRLNDPYNGQPYYKKFEEEDNLAGDMLPTESDKLDLSGDDAKGSVMYPYIKEEFFLCMDSDVTNSYKVLNPQENIIIPIVFKYRLDDSTNVVSKTMSFDLRTSLYSDPINYTFKVTAKMNNSTQDKLISTSRRLSKYNTTVSK